MVNALLIADTAFTDDLIRSMDIAVGVVVAIAVIFLLVKKANAPTDTADPSGDEDKS